MKVVYIKNNKYKKYKINNISGYKFKPRNKNINSLVITNNELIKKILSKKISKDIKKILVDHQKKGLKIFHTDGYEMPRQQLVWKLPSWD